MSSSPPLMDILYMQAFGHVLATFTRNAEPTQLEAGVDGFVGSDGFILRGLSLDPSHPDAATQQMQFVVPQDMIAVMHTVQPPTGQPPSPQLTYVSPLPPGTPAPQSFSSGSTISVSTTVNPPTLTPNGQAIPSQTQVLVLVFGPTGAPTPVQWTITAGAIVASTVTIPVPALTAGSYYVVAFVPSFPIAVGTYTVP